MTSRAHVTDRKHISLPRPDRFTFIRSNGGYALMLLSAPILWFLLKDPTGGAEAVKSGLSVAANAVIPSLFPFFVLAALLQDSGLAKRLGHLFSRPLRFLFGISGEGAGAVLLGAFCGFPVGARTVSALYEGGTVGKQEAERLLFLSNSPSLAFLYATVGSGFFGSPTFGRLLYCAVLLSVILSGILFRIVFGVCPMEASSAPATPVPRLSASLTNAVSSAVSSTLSVGGFIVFFGVLSASLSAIFASFGIGSTAELLLSGILEISSGTKKAAETVYGLCGRVLCAFFAGFGGLCAHLQVIATAERPLPDRARRKPLSFRSYFFCKVLQGCFTTLLVFLFSCF